MHTGCLHHHGTFFHAVGFYVKKDFNGCSTVRIVVSVVKLQRNSNITKKWCSPKLCLKSNQRVFHLTMVMTNGHVPISMRLSLGPLRLLMPLVFWQCHLPSTVSAYSSPYLVGCIGAAVIPVTRQSVSKLSVEPCDRAFPPRFRRDFDAPPNRHTTSVSGWR